MTFNQFFVASSSSSNFPRPKSSSALKASAIKSIESTHSSFTTDKEDGSAYGSWIELEYNTPDEDLSNFINRITLSTHSIPPASIQDQSGKFSSLQSKKERRGLNILINSLSSESLASQNSIGKFSPLARMALSNSCKDFSDYSTASVGKDLVLEDFEDEPQKYRRNHNLILDDDSLVNLINSEGFPPNNKKKGD